MKHFPPENINIFTKFYVLIIVPLYSNCKGKLLISVLIYITIVSLIFDNVFYKMVAMTTFWIFIILFSIFLSVCLLCFIVCLFISLIRFAKKLRVKKIEKIGICCYLFGQPF